MKKFGIDISKWQGKNFSVKNAIKEHSIEFAILKIGGADSGLYKDAQFENYYAQCEQNNLPKGCYFFGHAMSMSDAQREVGYWLDLMKGKKFEYPIYYDVERDMLNVNKRLLTDIIKYVCSTLEKNGYYVGIYTSASHFKANVYDSELKNFTHWVASYTLLKPTISNGGATAMWQFGGGVNKLRSTIINGVTCDQDYCYVDFPSAIKRVKLNGYSDATKVETKVKTVDELALEVIAGKWGNGIARKNALTKAGYSYKDVQSRVNDLLKK